MTTDALDAPEAGTRVLRGGTLRLLAFVVSTLLSLVGVVLLTRYLPVRDFGRFQTILSIVTVISTVTDLGMTTLALREWAQQPADRRGPMLRRLLGLRLVLTATGVVIGAAAAGVLAGGSVLAAGVAVMGAGAVVMVLQATAQVPLQGELRLGIVSAIDVGRAALMAIGFAVVIALDGGVLAVCAVMAPVNLALLALTVALVRDERGLRPAWDPKGWYELLRSAVAFAMATAVGIVYLYTAQVLCAAVATPEETGYFSAAFRVFIIVAQVPAVVMTAAFPLVSRAATSDPARLATILQGLFRANLLLGGAAMVACVVGAGPIIEVVGGREKYGPSVDVLQIQGLVLMVTFVIATWGFTLLALNRQRVLVVVNLVAFAVVVAVVTPLAAAYGEEGAAWGTLAGETVLLLGYGLALVRTRPELRPDLGGVGRVLLALAPALAVGLLGLPELLALALALVVFAGVAFLVRAVPEALFELLPGRS